MHYVNLGIHESSGGGGQSAASPVSTSSYSAASSRSSTFSVKLKSDAAAAGDNGTSQRQTGSVDRQSAHEVFGISDSYESRLPYGFVRSTHEFAPTSQASNAGGNSAESYELSSDLAHILSSFNNLIEQSALHC